MPESKKLSELISDLFYVMFQEKRLDQRSEEYHNNLKRVFHIQDKIDQKFAELRCDCKEDKDEWEVTYMGVPTSNRTVGKDKIRSTLPDINENCCMREGIEFSYYDGNLTTMKCSKHKYAPNSKKIS